MTSVMASGARKETAPVPRHAGAGEMTILWWIRLRVSRKGPRNCRSLGYARDDKKERVVVRRRPLPRDGWLLGREIH